ncbi:MAG: hypothetical protein Fur003_3500 [Candidatus Dojkabacteria bacterium]
MENSGNRRPEGQNRRPNSGGNGGYRRGGFNRSRNRGASFGQRGQRGGRGGFQNRNPKKKFKGEFIDEKLFIKKAVPQQEAVKYEHTFVYENLQLNSELKVNISKKGYFIPTPIQDKVIPQILAGKDIVGLANTGTGKTAAFLIPTIEKIIKDRSQKVLIIVPTRELAEQVKDEFFILTKHLGIYSALCIGGKAIGGQIRDLNRGSHFVIGTPGRLKDLRDRGAIDFSKFSTIILDEVDRMLDMGFINEIKAIIEQLPKERQSLFFSATMDKKVDALLHTIMKPTYQKISVVQGSASQNVDQDVIPYFSYDDKLLKFKEALKGYPKDKVLVFVSTKREVDKLNKMLFTEGFSVDAIHGNKRQNLRKRVIDKFKSGSLNILIATDVAARGLDIPKVALVLNYDVPNNYEDYVHRIGRTGRANSFGNALTMIKKGNS